MTEQLRSFSRRRVARLTLDRPTRPLRPVSRPVTGRPLDQTTQPPVATWERWYRYAVIGSDLLAITIGVLAIGLPLRLHEGPDGGAGYTALLAGTSAVVLCGALVASRAWRRHVLGQGAEEFRRLGQGLITATVVLALIALAVNEQGGRLWVFVVMPAIAVLAMPQRYLLRRWLHHARREGRCLLPVLAAGSTDTVGDLIRRTRCAPHVGWRVEAVCTVDTAGSGELRGVPVIGQVSDIAAHVRHGGYRIVAVTADPYWTPGRLQRLAWDLEGTDAEMVVAPVLMEVAGPRLHVSGVLGMPLLRVSSPAFTGARRVVKEIFDRCAAALLLPALAPFLLVIGLLVKLDSRGPMLYKQRRIGKDGRAFTMVKFRTMTHDAHRRRAELRAMNEGAGPLFKMRQDPRITRVGATLRRYSIDELPQLINVLVGTMSLVGPRPPLPEETATYGPDVRRRLLVKPGLTGLWQVSGRSDLPWDEAVRLDLRYVEDWSLALDAAILWKTIRAVFRGYGAY